MTKHGCLPLNVLDQRVEPDRPALHPDLPEIGAGQKQEIINDPRHAVDLLQAALQNQPVVLRGSRPAQCQFGLSLHDRQRRSQLVGGVGAEALNLPEGALKPGDHFIECVGQPTDLIGRL